MRENQLGILNGFGMILAGLLLSLLLSGSAWALTATDCATCHGADVVEGHHDTTDPNSDFSQGRCEICHVGVTTSGDCSTCHQPAGFANKHHFPNPGELLICAECHVDSGNPTVGAGDPKVCAACHTGDALPKPIRTFHHTQLTATIYYKDGKLNCAGCHEGAALTNACSSCHDDPANPFKYRAVHHNYAESNDKPCESCHSAIVVAQNCQSCHAEGSKRDSHHVYAKTNRFTCNGCHASLDAAGVGDDCARCHAPGNNREFHHGNVMATKNLTCTSCHAVTGGSDDNGCASCHTGDNQPEHHATPKYAAGDCGACHTSTGLDEPGCHSCHHLKLDDPLWAEHKHHDFERIATTYRLGCRDCHLFPNGSTMPQPMHVDDCVSCHEGVVQSTQGIPQNLQPKHHATASASAGNCALCHIGSKNVTDCASCHLGGTTPDAVAIHHISDSYASGNCAACHSGISGSQPCSACHTAAPGSTVVSRHHTQYAAAQNLTCSGCHTGSQAIFQSCGTGGCHTPTGIPVSDRHHNMTIQAQTQNCVYCHAGVDQTPVNDCAVCHVGAGKPPIAQRHHETDLFLTGVCEECHVNTAAADIDCSGCHAGSSLIKHHNKYVTINNSTQPKPCVDCHKVQLAGGSCEGCHTAPIPEIHHGDPLTAVSGNCSVCHQSISTPDSCSTCHTTSTHHATTWSQTGDCAHCHLVPASAADRPVQAACRECHGTKMHDKGGPIQNYGACAACHSTTPFHAYNSGDTGNTWNYSRDDYDRGGSGPGYDKFNMFVSQNSRRGEEGREAPRNHLSFSTKQISHAGKNYTVPYFTGMPTPINLALKKTATASGAESGYSASLAIDGSTSTRWWRKSTSLQWLKVDLGAAKTVSKVALRWHSYYAKSYQIQVSTDNSTWTTVFSNAYGAGGMETRTFTARSVRYIRIYCQTASSSNGYSIYELEAYAP